MAIPSELNNTHHSPLRPTQPRSVGGQQPSLDQGNSGGDLFVNSGVSGLGDFNAARALGRKLEELGRQQRAGQGSSVMFGQQGGGGGEKLTEMLKDGFDNLTGRVVHNKPLGLDGLSIRGNPVEAAVLKQGLEDIRSTKTGRHLLEKLAESGYEIRLVNKRDLKMYGQKVKGLTADFGFERNSDGNYKLKKDNPQIIALDLEAIQNSKTDGSFRDQVRNVLSHELGHAYQNVLHPNDVIWGRNAKPRNLEVYARNNWELPVKTEFNQNAGLWPMTLPDRRPDIKP